MSDEITSRKDTDGVIVVEHQKPQEQQDLDFALQLINDILPNNHPKKAELDARLKARQLKK